MPKLHMPGVKLSSAILIAVTFTVAVGFIGCGHRKDGLTGVSDVASNVCGSLVADDGSAGQGARTAGCEAAAEELVSIVNSATQSKSTAQVYATYGTDKMVAYMKESEYKNTTNAIQSICESHSVVPMELSSSEQDARREGCQILIQKVQPLVESKCTYSRGGHIRVSLRENARDPQMECILYSGIAASGAYLH